ncbi:MFS transporter [Apiospora arundinis]
MAFAFFGACAPGGGVFGFVFGGLFELAWWPWAFWSFAIALFFLTGFSVLIIPAQSRSPDQDKTMRQKLQILDVPGALTGVAALVLFNFAWNQGAAYGWNQPYIGVCLVLGILFAVGFFFIESRWAETPLVPFKVFTGDIIFVVACIACGWACFSIWVFYTSQFIEVLKGGLAAALCRVHLPSGHIGRVRIRGYWVPVAAHSSGMGYDLLVDLLHDWHHLDGNRPSVPDILGPAVCVSADYSFWHGYIVSRGNRHLLQRCCTGASGYGCGLGRYGCQLQYLAWARICWNHRSSCQQWR